MIKTTLPMATFFNSPTVVFVEHAMKADTVFDMTKFPKFSRGGKKP